MPAEAAGVQIGDIILQVDGTDVIPTRDVRELLVNDNPEVGPSSVSSRVGLAHHPLLSCTVCEHVAGLVRRCGCRGKRTTPCSLVVLL